MIKFSLNSSRFESKLRRLSATVREIEKDQVIDGQRLRSDLRRVTPVASASQIESGLRRDEIGLKRFARRGKPRSRVASETRADIQRRKSNAGRMRRSWKIRRKGNSVTIFNPSKGVDQVMRPRFRRVVRSFRKKRNRRIHQRIVRAWKR